jgi:hypothetical protein
LTKQKHTNSQDYEFYIKKELVENIPAEYFWVWSSTEHKDYTSYAWFVFFKGGYDHYYDKSHDGYVLCVSDSIL